MRKEMGPGGLIMGVGGRPDGTPVVFVHGAMDRGSGLLRIARLLPEASWWTYDRRGYGSSTTSCPVGIDVHVADLIVMLEHVTSCAGRAPIVVGHSVGGALALAAAQRRPELVASILVYEAPMSWMPFSAERVSAVVEGTPDAVAERFLRRALGDERWDALPDATRARRLAEGETLRMELMTAASGPFYDPARIAHRVVVAHGSEVHDVPRLASETILAGLPNGEHLVVDGAPHGAHLTHAPELADAVRDLLVGATPSSSVAP